jgi:hypothetical protein
MGHLGIVDITPGGCQSLWVLQKHAIERGQYGVPHFVPKEVSSREIEHVPLSGSMSPAILLRRHVPVRADESGACCKIDQSLNEGSGQHTLLRQKEVSRGLG